MNHGARPLRTTRKYSNLVGTRPGWYSITNKAATGGPSQVSIYDEIGFYGTSAGDFLAELRTITNDIELHLNSPGGDVFDGIAIYNCLKQRAGNVHVIVDGLAASAASFIAQAASPGMLEMAPHSQMMIHDGFAMGIGNASDMRELADQLDQVSDEIASIYSERTGKPRAYWRGLMQNETWLTDAQAVSEGLADKIHGQESVSNDWDLSVFANFIAPGYPSNASSKCPGCGKYNSPDADSCSSCSKPMKADAAAGDVTNDAADGDPGKKECPLCKGSGKILDGHRKCPDCQGTGKVSSDADDDSKSNRLRAWPALDADVDTSAWDAAKAWSAGADADDPAAFYKGICAGRKAGDPTTQAAWALPFKYSPSSPPNAAGVRNALARLSQTQGLTNEPEAKSTLEKAMKLVNPNYEPSSDRLDTELLAQVFSLGLEGANR